MSDLCSPMIILLDDEADSFWVFERLMRRLVLSLSLSVTDAKKNFGLYLCVVVIMKSPNNGYFMFKRGNFRCTERSVGVENQLQTLASITQVVDPKLHQHLGNTCQSYFITNS